jgi:hypothetical protein
MTTSPRIVPPLRTRWSRGFTERFNSCELNLVWDNATNQLPIAKFERRSMVTIGSRISSRLKISF